MRALLLLVVVACSNGVKHDDPPPVVTTTPEAPRAMPKVILGPDAIVNVEVVATEPKIQKGLMYRQHLPPDDGMLFLMPGDHALEREGWPFWMHNTLISLDLMWIDKDMQIVEIFENAQPRNDDEVGGHVPSRYVLEVNGGYVAAHHVAKGTKVRFDGVR